MATVTIEIHDIGLADEEALKLERILEGAQVKVVDMPAMRIRVYASEEGINTPATAAGTLLASLLASSEHPDFSAEILQVIHRLNDAEFTLA